MFHLSCVLQCNFHSTPTARLAQEDVALDMHRNMPAALLALFTPVFEGPLVSLPESKGVRTPTAAEVSLNYVFLLPFVKAYPSKEGGSR